MSRGKLRTFTDLLITFALLTGACRPLEDTATKTTKAPTVTTSQDGIVTTDNEPSGPTLSPFQEPVPEDIAPPPRLCDPAAPELLELGALGGPETVQTEVGIALRVRLENSSGQTFALTFTGANEELVRAEIERTQVCLEAQQFDIPLERAPLPPIEDMVIQAVVQITGLPREALADIRDANSMNDSPSLAEIAAALGADLDLVIKTAQDAAVSAFPGVDLDVIKEAIKGILEQPDAPALFHPAELPGDDSGYFDLLPENFKVVIVDVDLIDPNLEDLRVSENQEEGIPVAIAFVFDPVLSRTTTVNRSIEPTHRYYRAKCQYSAYVRLHAKAGRMDVTFWRKSPYYLDIGYRYASTAWQPDPAGLWHSSGSLRSYDIGVKGWQDGSQYDLDGSWVLGWGGSC